MALSLYSMDGQYVDHVPTPMQKCRDKNKKQNIHAFYLYVEGRSDAPGLYPFLEHGVCTRTR